ncbi:MAG: hypothetical protein FJ123_18890 [Deltaproteobacteria bacterium]|nr:hypothetical protein [Deltaproteobacteria bacterium]
MSVFSVSVGPPKNVTTPAFEYRYLARIDGRYDPKPTAKSDIPVIKQAINKSLIARHDKTKIGT